MDEPISKQSIKRHFENTINMLYGQMISKKLIYCKDCGKWNMDKNRINEGFCCIHNIMTEENYYCADAKMKEETSE